MTNQFLGDTDSTNTERTQTKKQQSNLYATFSDFGATLIGATVIAFNIAPTDEIPMLSQATVSPPWLLVIIATSLVISYGIVFQAGFSD